MDDFGTGYSSLTHLKRFPLDELKIDKSFVDGLGEHEDGAIVAAILGMAHALDLTVVAEGVETEEQLCRLRSLGCEGAQGYYFSPPWPAATIDDLLAGATQVPAGGEHRPVPTGRETVVVVDDAPDVRQAVRMSLTPAGYVVHEASSGEEALSLAGEVRPDCVLVDIDMPGMNGFELCRALRAQGSTSECTVVMLTSAASPADKVEAFSLGVDDYIVKSFVPRGLVTRISSASRRRKEMPEPPLVETWGRNPYHRVAVPGCCL